MLNLIGEKYGKLLVLKEVDRIKDKRAFLCECECGTQKIIRMADLRSGKIISCGCARKEKIAAASKAKASQININKGNDLIGQKFGRLTVIELDEETTLKKRTENNKRLYWKCKCECGNTKSIAGSSLKNGTTKSCGCLQKEASAKNIIKGQYKAALSRRKDLTNQKFGLLTAIKINEKVTKERKEGRVYWDCVCSCGNSKVVSEGSLVSGKTQSCGCLKSSKGEFYIEKILKENDISFLKEVAFNDLKDKKELRFDFAILNKEKQIIELIEFDGRQHSDPSSIWYNKKYLFHDQLKNQWCKDNNIPLIRIPYTHLDDLCLEDLQLETSNFIYKGE